MKDLLLALYNNQQFSTLLAAIVLNLGLGIAASIKRKDFELVRLADFLTSRLIPVGIGYGAAALATYVAPDATIPGLGMNLPAIRDLGFTALLALLVGYIVLNIADVFGVKSPEVIAKTDSTLQEKGNQNGTQASAPR